MKYLLVGLGKSNLSIATHLAGQHIPFDVFTDKACSNEGFPSTTEFFTDVALLDMSEYEYCIKSPGIPHTHPVIALVSSSGLVLQNEISYALPHVNQLLIGITGTNGKTTVTSLVSHILSDKRAQPVGNIGNSFFEAALKTDNPLVAELSSFQLKDLTYFNPDVSAFLNFQPSHLDYHSTLEDYFSSKEKIVSTQSTNKPFIYNQDDAEVFKIALKRGGNLRSFSLVDETAAAYFDGETFFIYGDPWLTKEDVSLIGNHNYQNILAAILISYSYESSSTIIECVKSFTGVEHRLEKVSNNEGIPIYNDAKSTNPAAVISALRSFDKPLILLIGGKDRGNDFSDVFTQFPMIRHVCLYGEVAKKLYAEFHPHLSMSLHSNLTEATQEAFVQLNSEDTLLFSPGCASWDQFQNYEERGKLFKSLVPHHLKQKVLS